MTKRAALVGFAVFLGSLGGTVAARAQTGAPEGTASSDHARLAAVIYSNPGSLGAVVVRSQGVASVTNPVMGRFA